MTSIPERMITVIPADRDDNVNAFMAQLEAYRAYVRRHKDRMPEDLYDFLAGGFFHDGRIEKFDLHWRVRELTLEISCPNIKKKNGDGDFDFEFLPEIDFRCRLSGLRWFEFEDSWDNDPNYFGPQVLNWEVQVLGKGRRSSPYALFLDSDPTCHFVAIFDDVQVEAANPDEFLRMKNSDEYELPYWH